MRFLQLSNNKKTACTPSMPTLTSPAPLRNRLLDESLASESPLRHYLQGKPETARVSGAADASQNVTFRSCINQDAPISLVFPPTSFSPGSIKRVIPPLGLLYISAALKASGWKTQVIDCVALDPLHEVQQPNGLIAVGLSINDAAARILAGSPSTICISVLYSCDLATSFSLAQEIRALGFQGPIIFGGLHASIYPAEILTSKRTIEQTLPTADFVIRGEGEKRLPALLEGLIHGVFNINADGLCGLFNERIFLNPQIQMIEELDSLPFPDYESINLELYFSLNLPFSPFPKGERVMQILTSRGCPVGCTFCASTNFNRKFRARSVENVIAEIKYLKENFNIDEIQFADDNLTLDPRRACQLFDAISDFDLPWCTPNGIMVNTLDFHLIQHMINSGMYQITLSFDGGTDLTLKNIHRKPVNLHAGFEIASELMAADILIHTTLVVGMPGETINDISEAFDFIKSLPVHSVAVFFAQALPGSELYERLITAKKISILDARTIDTANPMIGVSDIPPGKLRELVDDFMMEFNLSVKKNYPSAWIRKYEKHVKRIEKWKTGATSTHNFRHII